MTGQSPLTRLGLRKLSEMPDSAEVMVRYILHHDF